MSYPNYKNHEKRYKAACKENKELQTLMLQRYKLRGEAKKMYNQNPQTDQEKNALQDKWNTLADINGKISALQKEIWWDRNTALERGEING